LLTEIGLAPGIDHMSLNNTINEFKNLGGDLSGVETFNGSLIAPEDDNNPWHFKFTWNPMDVIRAGKKGARFIHNGRVKYIPFNNVYKRIELIEVPGFGMFEGFPDRNTLAYKDLYGLGDVSTFFRGTIRPLGFCSAWNIFVQLGIIDDSFTIEDSEHLTYRSFLNSFLFYRKSDSLELKLAYTQGLSIDSPQIEKIKWLGLFDTKPIGLVNATPEAILKRVLEKKWRMLPHEKDIVIVFNKISYTNPQGIPTERIEYLICKGENKDNSAKAKSIGLPLAIATKLILNGQLKKKGVILPVTPDIYKPIMKELSEHGIQFKAEEKQIPITEI